MTEKTDRKLQQQVLLSRRVEGDRLLLADDVMNAALEGSRHLTMEERTALQASPLTLRRFRVLSQQRRQGSWRGSRGMLRAAADGAQLGRLTTDDGFWTLHFLQQEGVWRVILALDAKASFAPELLQSPRQLRVTDGAGSEILNGRLDPDGELETAWPFAQAPAAHFQAHGAAFAVEPVR